MLNLSLRASFIIPVLCAGLIAISTPALGESETVPAKPLPETVEPMTKKMEDVIKEISTHSELTPDAARMMYKAGHGDTLEWMKKQSETKDNYQFLSADETLDFIETHMATPPTNGLKGLYTLRQGGLDTNIWQGYSRSALEKDFERVVKSPYLTTAHYKALRLILLSYADSPSGYSDQSFALFRINALLQLGFFDDAMAYYKVLAADRDQLTKPLLKAGITALIMNNQFDAACLESGLNIPLWKQDEDEEAEEFGQPTFFKALNSLCYRYLKNDSDNAAAENEAKDETLGKDNHVSDVFFTKNHLHPLVPFITGTLDKTGLSMKADLKNLTAIKPLYQKPFLRQASIPSSLRHKIFRDLQKSVYFSADEYHGLFAFDPTYASLAGQIHYSTIMDEEDAFKRLDLIKKQVLINKNPSSPLSTLYLKRARAVKVNERFVDYASFLSLYFAANAQIERAVKWAHILPDTAILEKDSEKEKKVTIKTRYDDLSEMIEKNPSFFIFLLEHWQQIMLKETVLMAESASNHGDKKVTAVGKTKRFHDELDTNVMKSLKQGSILDRKGLTIETPEFKDLDHKTKKDFDYFEDAATSYDTAKTVVLSMVLWDELLTQKNNNETATPIAQPSGKKEFAQYANFILHRLSKSDLNNYALSLGFGITTE